MGSTYRKSHVCSAVMSVIRLEERKQLCKEKLTLCEISFFVAGVLSSYPVVLLLGFNLLFPCFYLIVKLILCK
jgi:hypothetical protein